MAITAPFISAGTSSKWRVKRMDSRKRSRLRAARHHQLRFAVEDDRVADMAGGDEGDAAFGIDGADGDPRLDGVADLDRRLELQALAQVDAARPRQLGAEHRRD